MRRPTPTLPNLRPRVPSLRSVPTGAPVPSNVAPVLALVVLLGAAVTALAFSRPLLALGVPFLALGAVYCWRHPVGAVTTVFLLSGIVGTMTALSPIPAIPVIEYILACLWVGAVGTLALGRRRAPLWLWPGLVAPALYIILSALSIFVSDSIGNAIEGFRLSIWYMAAFLLIAIAPWPSGATQRMARAVAFVAVVVAAYCVFRYFVGASGTEQAFARDTAADTPMSVDLRFFGSFLSANQLAAWMAAVIPFLLALMLGWRGGWRLLALAGLGLCGFCVFASDVRIGLIAAVGGSAAVIAIYAFARSFPQTRVANAIGAVSLIALVGAIAYSLTVANDPESVERYSKIFEPEQDYAYQVRQNYWDAAWSTIDEHPFGQGFGSSGAIGNTKSEHGPAAGLYNVDSSFLKIALEQGLPVLIFFIVAMVALLLSLTWRAITITDRQRATLGMGACGTILALLTLFYAGLYIENVAALMGWLLVGLGAAQFTRLDDPRETAPDDGAVTEPAPLAPAPGLAVAPDVARSRAPA